MAKASQQRARFVDRGATSGGSALAKNWRQPERSSAAWTAVPNLSRIEEIAAVTDLDIGCIRDVEISELVAASPIQPLAYLRSKLSLQSGLWRLVSPGHGPYHRPPYRVHSAIGALEPEAWSQVAGSATAFNKAKET